VSFKDYKLVFFVEFVWCFDLMARFFLCGLLTRGAC